MHQQKNPPYVGMSSSMAYCDFDNRLTCVYNLVILVDFFSCARDEAESKHADGFH